MIKNVGRTLVNEVVLLCDDETCPILIRISELHRKACKLKYAKNNYWKPLFNWSHRRRIAKTFKNMESQVSRLVYKKGLQCLSEDERKEFEHDSSLFFRYTINFVSITNRTTYTWILINKLDRKTS